MDRVAGAGPAGSLRPGAAARFRQPRHVRIGLAPVVEDIRGIVRRFMPRADGPLRKSAVCLYTNTPDEHFWIDRHPAHAQVLIVSACSGHGFKFASVIGEIVADLLVEGRSRFDLSLFRNRGL